MAAAAAFLPPSAPAQGLEDKLTESRRTQSSTVVEMDQRTLDSLLQVRRERAAPEAGGETRRPRSGLAVPKDSMLAGPYEMDEGATDSLVDGRERKGRDSLLVRKGRGRRDTLRRYEQRVFRSTDPSVFSSALGGAGRDHILGPGDAVSVYLWGDKEKMYALELNSDGKIFLEGIGLVPLAGQTLDEATMRLKERLGRIYSGIARGTTRVELALDRQGPLRAFLLGEVKSPGGYVFSGNTSVLSALYFAKGPTDIGSVRNLQLTRGGKKHSLDLYKYLMKGENLSPGTLQNGDILFSPRAESLVEIRGDVGRPAIYELKAGEGVKELLEYAGGANPSAARQRMTVQRILPGGRVEYRDLEAPHAYIQGGARFDLQDGDRLLVHRSTESAGNFLTVSGPVMYPGTYSAEGVASVRDVVAKAGGLREDAYLGRVHIVRLRPDGSSSLLAYSLDSTIADSIRILPEDKIILYSIKDMYSPDSVEVAGAVYTPGRYEFREGMSVKDLIMQAGGFRLNHERGSVIVFRGDVLEARVSQIKVDVGPGLAKTKDSFPLKPRDFVHVPEDPRWYDKEIVVLSGLFKHPGKYALLHRGERLSSVIGRAGGFKESAYTEGARFFRLKDSVGRMGVDISTAVARPRSKANINLMGGDSIYIPERAHTVKVIGEVGFETSVIYRDGSPVQYYIEKAGGFTRRSEKERIVVQYANGEMARDGYFNRKPDAGSVIFVPQGPEPKQVDYFAGINAILGTLGVVLALVLSIQAISK